METETLPKSYLADSEREGLTQNGIYLAESMAAGDAGDEETAWQWLSYAVVPAHALKSLKTLRGAEFIREKGLRTETAQAEYGENWLDEN
ncbi:MAG: hypothetical protein Q4G54_01510 [Pelistega sp.]|nr:hypothetical protein [Pelistega sp.]